MSLLDRYHQEMREAYEPASKNGNAGRFAHGMGLLKLFWIFNIASFFGSVMEMVWCVLDRGYFEIRTSVAYGFMIPIYGFGAVAMSAGLYKFYKRKAFWLFLGGAVIGSGVEYLASIIQEVFYHTRSWDYSNTPLSIQGRTNLMFAFLWGVLSVLWVKVVLPSLSKCIERIPHRTGIFFTVLLIVYLSVQMVLTTSALYRQMERRKDLPPSSLFEEYLDRTLPDKYLDLIFSNMNYLD